MDHSDLMDLVQTFAKARVMNEAAGAVLYGGDLNRWPSRLVDAFMVLQDEQTRVDSLRMSRGSKDSVAV